MSVRKLHDLLAVVIIGLAMFMTVPVHASLTDDHVASTLQAGNDAMDNIELSYRRGEISYNDMIALKARAIFDPTSVPGKYLADTITARKDITMDILDIRRSWGLLDSATKELLQGYHVGPLESPGSLARTGTSLTQAEASWLASDWPGSGNPVDHYATAHFCLHYTDLGPHQVDLTDTTPANGIPDLVEVTAQAAETSYSKQVTNLQWLTHRGDGTRGNAGSCSGTGKMDVYFVAFSVGALGIADVEEYDLSTSNANDASGFIGLAQSFAGYGYPGIGADLARVVMAHEYNHQLQFAYNVWVNMGGWDSGSWLYEATATWMEDEVFDNVNDYTGYLYYFLTTTDYSLVDTTSLREYSSCIFMKYLSERFGALSVRRTWEHTISSTLGDPIGFNPSVATAILESSRGTNGVVQDFEIANRRMMVPLAGWFFTPTYGYEEASLAGYSPATPDGTINYIGASTTWDSATNGDGILESFAADHIRIVSTVGSGTITFDGQDDKTFSVTVLLRRASGATRVLNIALGAGNIGSRAISSLDAYADVTIVVLLIQSMSSTAEAQYQITVSP